MDNNAEMKNQTYFPATELRKIHFVITKYCQEQNICTKCDHINFYFYWFMRFCSVYYTVNFTPFPVVICIYVKLISENVNSISEYNQFDFWILLLHIDIACQIVGCYNLASLQNVIEID